jgi:rhodanese-related sulfurtransferase
MLCFCCCFRFLCVAVVVVAAAAQSTTTTTTTTQHHTLSNTSEFYDGVMNNTFRVLIDVRSETEFNSGHIENATLVANFASGEVELPSSVLDCGGCTMVVYCRSGARAAVAIQRLIDEYQFEPTRLYNGLGTSQWTNDGFPLVDTPSVDDPMCYSTCHAADDVNDDDDEEEEDDSTVITTLSTTELYTQHIIESKFDIVFDVRTSIDAFLMNGHVPNATLLTTETFDNLLLVDDGITNSILPCLSSNNNNDGNSTSHSSCQRIVLMLDEQSGGGNNDTIAETIQAYFSLSSRDPPQFYIYHKHNMYEWKNLGYELVYDTTSKIPNCITGNNDTTGIDGNVNISSSTTTTTTNNITSTQSLLYSLLVCSTCHYDNACNTTSTDDTTKTETSEDDGYTNDIINHDDDSSSSSPSSSSSSVVRQWLTVMSSSLWFGVLSLLPM